MEYVITRAITNIGLSMTINCISTLTSSAQNIYSLLSNITVHNNVKDVSKVIRKLDIRANVNIIESLLNEINLENFNKGEKKDEKQLETLQISIKNVSEIVSEIEILLRKIDNRLKYNSSLWLGVSYRKYAFDDIIEDLTEKKDILKERVDILFNIIKITDFLCPTHTQKMEQPVINLYFSDEKDKNKIKLLNVQTN